MYDVLCVGSSICDIIVNVSDKFIKDNGFIKGSMKLCDKEEIDHLLENFTNFSISSGGSAANTISHLAKYGSNNAFIGNVAEGYFGKKFIEDMQRQNIEFFNVHENNQGNTAKCLGFNYSRR